MSETKYALFFCTCGNQAPQIIDALETTTDQPGWFVACECGRMTEVFKRSYDAALAWNAGDVLSASA